MNAQKFLLLLILYAPFFVLADEVSTERSQSRELQLLWVNSGFQIGVDTDPAWRWHSVNEDNFKVFIIDSPDNYYPPATVNVRFNKWHKFEAFDFKFKKTAYFIIAEMQKKMGSTTEFKFFDLVDAQYGELKGYEQVSTINVDGVQLSSKVFVGLNSESALIILNASTLPGKIPHLQPVLNRFWGSIKFLNSSALDK
jgi:hypothetical protein